MLGGMFYDFAGIRSSFQLTSAMLAISGMTVLFGVHESPRGGEEGSIEGEAEPGKAKLPYRALIPALVTLLLAHVTITSANVNLPGFMASMGVDERIVSHSGRLIAAAALLAAAGAAAGGRLAGRFGTRRVTLVLLLAAGVTAMPQALAGGLTELWMLRLSSSFFVGGLIPVANLYIKNEVPEERQGAAFGIASSAVSAGFALGPIGDGLLAYYLGFWAPFFVPGVLLVCASAGLSTLAGNSGTGYRRLRAIWKTMLAHLVRSE